MVEIIYLPIRTIVCFTSTGVNVLQKRYPALNITEEDLVNAKKEFEEIMKEDKEKREKIAIEEKERNNVNSDEEQTNSAETSQIEDKKTI